MDEIEIKLKKIIEQVKNKKTIDLKMDDTFMDIGLNSIDFIKVVVALEEELGLEFEDQYLNINSFKNLQVFINYLKSKL